MITASDANTASAVLGRMVSEPPLRVCSQEPIHSATIGPPTHTFVATTAISAARPTCLGREAATGMDSRCSICRIQ